MRFKSMLVAAALMLVHGGIAHAVPVTLDFTAIGFSSSAPESSVTGTLVYEADSAAAITINSLTSIDLTIAGHAYTLGEVGFISPFGVTQNIVGGILDGTFCPVSCIPHGINDFWLQWDAVAQIGVGFAYSVTGGTLWTTPRFTEFKITAASVPEPKPITLLGIGLLAVWIFRRRRGFLFSRCLT